MSSLPWRRIGAVVLLILSFIALPFWMTLIFTVFFLYVFDYFAEAVFIFFLADTTYAVALERFHGFEYSLTVIALLLFLLSLLIKPYLLR